MDNKFTFTTFLSERLDFLEQNQSISNTSLFVFQITRRYAEVSAAIVSLNESFPDEKV